MSVPLRARAFQRELTRVLNSDAATTPRLSKADNREAASGGTIVELALANSVGDYTLVRLHTAHGTRVTTKPFVSGSYTTCKAIICHPNPIVRISQVYQGKLASLDGVKILAMLTQPLCFYHMQVHNFITLLTRHLPCSSHAIFRFSLPPPPLALALDLLSNLAPSPGLPHTTNLSTAWSAPCPLIRIITSRPAAHPPPATTPPRMVDHTHTHTYTRARAHTPRLSFLAPSDHGKNHTRPRSR